MIYFYFYFFLHSAYNNLLEIIALSQEWRGEEEIGSDVDIRGSRMKKKDPSDHVIEREAREETRKRECITDRRTDGGADAGNAVQFLHLSEQLLFGMAYRYDRACFIFHSTR